jgi:hypothetical protein
VARGQSLDALLELGVAVGGFGELQLGGGGLEVVAQKGGVVAVARGVDADADAHRRSVGARGGGFHKGRHKDSGKGCWDRGRSRESPPRGRTTRKLVIRGQRLKT